MKHCFYLGQDSKVEGDRFKKARLPFKHLQAKFTEMYVLEQEISHDEAIIKYFTLGRASSSSQSEETIKIWFHNLGAGHCLWLCDVLRDVGLGTFISTFSKFFSSPPLQIASSLQPH